VWYLASGSVRLIVSTFSDRNPASTRCRRTKLLIINPAPINKTKAAATSATTSRLRTQWLCRLSPALPPSFTPVCPSPFEPATARLQRGLRVSFGTLKRGSQAKDDARQQRQERCEGYDPQVQTDFACARQDLRGHRHQYVDAPLRQQESERPAERRQQQAFSQKLPHKAEASRAERQANAYFTPSSRGPRQQQVRYVHAGDQQNEANGAEQRQQRRARVTDNRFL